MLLRIPFLRPLEPHERASRQLAETRHKLLDARGELEWAQAQVKLLEAREARLRAFISQEVADDEQA